MKNSITKNNKKTSSQILEELLLHLKSNASRLAKDLGYNSNVKIQHIKSGRNNISVEVANDIINKFPEFNYDWLMTGEGEMLKEEKQNIIPQGELKPKEYSHTLEVRLVTNKAKAGWSDGYYNDEYLENMPVITIDADANYKGNYLAFEVAGDSMEPDYLEGDIVICREMQRHLWNSKLHFKDWDFVIAHSKQGIMLKEIIDHNVETGDIICRSINPQYKDFTLNLKEIAFLYNVVEVRQKGKRKRWNRARDFFNE